MFCNKNTKRAVALSNCASLQRAAAVDDRHLATCLWHQSKVLRRVSPTSDKSPPQDRSSQVYGRHPCLCFPKNKLTKALMQGREPPTSNRTRPPRGVVRCAACGFPISNIHIAHVDKMLQSRSLLGSPPPPACGLRCSAATCPQLR